MLHVDVDVELETREASKPRETVENFGEDLKLHRAAQPRPDAHKRVSLAHSRPA